MPTLPLWSEEEDQIIRSYLPRHGYQKTIKLIKQKFGVTRSLSAVRSRAYKHGVAPGESKVLIRLVAVASKKVIRKSNGQDS